MARRREGRHDISEEQQQPPSRARQEIFKIYILFGCHVHFSFRGTDTNPVNLSSSVLLQVSSAHMHSPHPLQPPCPALPFHDHLDPLRVPPLSTLCSPFAPTPAPSAAHSLLPQPAPHSHLIALQGGRKEAVQVSELSAWARARAGPPQLQEPEDHASPLPCEPTLQRAWEQP